MIALALVLTCLLLASAATNFRLYRKWIDSQSMLGEVIQQLTRSARTVEDYQEQLAVARVLLALMLAAWAALKEENEKLRLALEQSERFGLALGKSYENTKAELAVSDVRLREREEEIKIFYSVVDTLSRTIASERNTRARIDAIQEFIKRCKELMQGFLRPV
jgi:hypothetical protein